MLSAAIVFFGNFEKEMTPSNPSPFEDSTLSSDDSPFTDSALSSSIGAPSPKRPSANRPASQYLGVRIFVILFALVMCFCGVAMFVGTQQRDLGVRHYNAGLKLQKAGDTKGAIAEYSKSIDTDSSDEYKAERYVHRGVLYFRTKQHDKAFSDFNKAIALDTTQDAPFYNLGLIYSERGNYSEAIKDFDKSAELNPKDNDVYSERAEAYVHLKKIDLAVDQARQLMARGEKLKSWAQDDLVKALSDQVSVKVDEQDYPAALSEINDLVLVAPNLTDSYRRRAAIYLLIHDAPHARADINKCRELGGDISKVEPLVKGLEKGK